MIGLNAVTLYDYLYYLISRQHSIPYFQLKLTRVRNYVSLFTDPFTLSPHIKETLHRFRKGDFTAEADHLAITEARSFLKDARRNTLVYEGAIISPGKAKDQTVPTTFQRRKPIWSRARDWADRVRQLHSIQDPHYPNLLVTAVQAKLIKPLRRRFLSFAFDIDDAETYAREHAEKYAVYPLNTEPEVALLAFGRPFRNQIETVRNIAASLPVGWKLVVKEHPNAYGYRTPGYYRKLKQIPNVVLASPTARTGKLTDGCGLVVLVYGTIGLEAIIKGKPTVVLCENPYGVFPPTMVRYAPNLWLLGQEIRELLDHYRYDEQEIESFLAAHIRCGIRINLFTGLLGKGGRQAENMTRSVEEQYAELARYTRNRVHEEIMRLSACNASGS